MKFKNIIFIGPQGSGKGTQVIVLAQKIGATIIETGALCREAAKQDSDFGRHIKELIEHGMLVSDADIQHLVSDKLAGLQADQAVIFDGIPRRESQAVFLFEELGKAGRKDVASLYITLPREESVKRLMSRRVCENCKSPAIFSGDPSQVCANCGGKLVMRADDNLEAVNKRLDQYEAETFPVVELLKKHSVLFEINGNQPIEKVTADINKALEV